MGKRRDQLAVRTILVTFYSALHTISLVPVDRDTRILLGERARDRALRFLGHFERNVRYEPGSYLDEAVRHARRRIERAKVDQA